MSSNNPPLREGRSRSRPRLILSALPVLLSVAVAACGGSSDQPVQPCAVSSVRVSPESSTVAAGETRQFSAMITATNCSPLPTVQWSSSTQSVATVSATGLVTTIAAGRTTILASALGQIAVGALTVSPPAIATIGLTPGTAALTVGGSTTLVAVPRDNAGNALTGRTLTWSSLSPAVASVSTGGVVTALSAGSATINVTSEGRSATAAVTVTLAPVNSVAITPTTASVQIGGLLPLTATLRDASNVELTGRSVVWSSGTPALASVSATGVVTGIAAGTVTITATSEGRSATAAITVAPVPVNSIVITPSTGTVLVATFLQLTATLRDASNNVLTGRTVTWTSSSPARATVSSGGYVIGVTTGAVTITATSEGKSATASLTVNPLITSVEVTPNLKQLLIGATLTPTVVARNAGGAAIAGRAVTWSSVNPAIASVNATTGVITAVSAGSVNIQATVDGVVGAMVVNVIRVNEGDRFAYAWVERANEAIGVSYAPSSIFRKNVTGGAIMATRTATGTYDVLFERLAKFGRSAFRENVFVSPYAIDGRTCNVTSWSDVGDDLRATVFCVSLAGGSQAVNSAFNIVVLGSGTLGGYTAFFSNGSASASAAALTGYSFASFGGVQFSSRLGTGRYAVNMGQESGENTISLVSAITPRTSCHVQSRSAPNTTNVYCTNADNNSFIDAQFNTMTISAGRLGVRWGWVNADLLDANLGVAYSPTSANKAQSNNSNTFVVHNSTGNYTVTFTNLARPDSDGRDIVLVGAQGNAPVTCSVGSWGSAGAHLTVNVHCHSMQTQNVADAAFRVIVLE